MQETELLYLTDSYLREFDAKVLRAEDGAVVLDRTAFYPRGGGQMSDRGVLRALGNEYPVVAVEKRGAQVFHTIQDESPIAGLKVHGVVDWEHRYNMMRTHTALHVLSGVIYREFGAQVTGCQMYPE